MAVNITILDQLARAIPPDQRRGHVLTLGVQASEVPKREFPLFLARLGLAKLDPRGGSMAVVPALHAVIKDLTGTGRFADKFDSERVSTEALLRCLGYSSVAALDANDYEDPDHVVDLNAAECAADLIGSADLILDGGTLEHVFHLPNALGNIHAMLKENGFVFHSNPTNNHVDHGFYQLSPTFYRDYYESNGYELRALALTSYDRFKQTPFAESDLLLPHPHLNGRLDDRKYLTSCIARKLPKATGGVVPMQQMFRTIWSQSSGR